ncbi:hypothetical protein LSH36_887g02089 [Paralvinella palmiformis]|uniref:Major facilitator superfamily (MFS) profile domain-containing protein n=1 Tax=Paralvinella palmiformis TaxID=53620 RepID=A0AAD9IYF3_9ANNE|nr:hypothetical protein LSH36_887g02089 [Paralvinella palmiformis]
MFSTEDGNDRQSFVCSFRFGLAILGFFIFLHNHMQRVSMSVAILCMVNQTAMRMLNDQQPMGSNLTDALRYSNATTDLFHNTSSNDVIESTCSGNRDQSSEVVEDGPFIWDRPTQGHVLGSYFYGYFIASFPFGLLAEKFGPKWPLFIAYSMGTVSTLLTPLAARISPYLLIALRILIGIGSGALFPCMHTMWSHWAPPMERSKLAGVNYAGTSRIIYIYGEKGCMAAAMVGLPLSGVLCKYGFSEGWDSIFYVIGSSSAVVIILWVIFASNSPAESTRVSNHEKRYILSSLKGQVSEERTEFGLPWKAVLSSRPVWAIIVSNFCSDWGLYTLLTNIPTFLSEVLQFNIQSNGVLSALPFVGLWINMNLSPVIADKLRSARILSTTATRKIFNSIGMLAPAVFLIGLGFVECEQAILGVALLTVCVTLSGCAYTGFLVNHMDIAPRYAGTLLGISNGIGAISGFVAPSVAAAITTGQTRVEWQMVFYISSAIYTFGAIIYVIFASGTIQSWACDQELNPEVLELRDKKPSENDRTANEC